MSAPRRYLYSVLLEHVVADEFLRLAFLHIAPSIPGANRETLSTADRETLSVGRSIVNALIARKDSILLIFSGRSSLSTCKIPALAGELIVASAKAT